MDGYDFKPKPPRAVTDYLKNKGLKPSFSWLDVWGQEHAYAFTVAKATQINVLSDIREELQRALDDGLPFSEFQKQLKASNPATLTDMERAARFLYLQRTAFGGKVAS